MEMARVRFVNFLARRCLIKTFLVSIVHNLSGGSSGSVSIGKSSGFRSISQCIMGVTTRFIPLTLSFSRIAVVLFIAIYIRFDLPADGNLAPTRARMKSSLVQ